MYRRLSSHARPRSGTAILATAALSLAGCTQATRHANMMIFGTNTVVGLSVGKDVDTPAITLGYKRQELVLMPLVANARDNANRELEPCDMTAAASTTEWSGTGETARVTRRTEAVAAGNVRADHPCLLAATRGDGKTSTAKDSYSVLASFGADFQGGVDTRVEAKGGLAQYFATGMAAQLLALSGGAAVVATGNAAQMSAAVKPDAGAVAILSGDAALATALADPAIKERAARDAESNKAAATVAAQYLANIADDGAFKAEVGVLDGAAGLNGALIATCVVAVKKENCIKQLPAVFAGGDPKAIMQAVIARAAARGGK